MEGSVKLSVVATRFSLREDKAEKVLLEWGNNLGIVVMHKDTDGEVFVQESLFNELERGEAVFDSFVYQTEIETNRVVPGREYNQSYIYFLLEEGEVVYVGQTVNLQSRLASHARDKFFDSVAVCQVHKSLLDVVEQANIIHYNPKLNGTMWSQKAVFKRLLALCDMGT